MYLHDMAYFEILSITGKLRLIRKILGITIKSSRDKIVL